MRRAEPSAAGAGDRAGLPTELKTTVAASAFSGFGDGLVAAAFPLLINDATDNAILVAGVVAVQKAPWLLSLYGGAIVDRVSLRRLLPTVDLLRFAVVAGLTAVVALDLPVVVPLYLAALVVGIGDTIIASGLHAAVPQMVDDDLLDRANGAMFVSQSATEHLAGPALGGVLFAVAASLPLGVDAMTFLLSAGMLAASLPARTSPPTTRTVTSDVVEGVRWFFAQVDLRQILVLIGTFATLQGGVLAVLVILVDDRLAGDSVTYGLVLAAAAVGNLLGGALTERVSRIWPIPTTLMVGGLATGLAYVGLGYTTSAVLAGLCLAVEGLAVGIANVAALGYRQRRVPTAMLGRGAATVRLVAFGSIPVGALVAGSLTEVVGVGPVVAGMGVLQAVVAVVFGPRLARAMAAVGADPWTGRVAKPDTDPDPDTDHDPDATADADR